MMNRDKSPIWHKRKKTVYVPDHPRSLDKEAIWCTSYSDGWMHVHGSYSLASHRHLVLDSIMRMLNSSNEAKRMWQEATALKGHIDYVPMDSKTYI